MGTEKQTSLPVLLSLIAVMVVPVYLYGMRPVMIALCALATAVICDILFKKLFHIPRKKGDWSSLSAAMIIALMMPATVDYFVVVVAVLSGLLIAKYAFGGTGNHIFHPSALGLAIVGLSFPEQVLAYPNPKQMLDLGASIWQNSDIIYATTPASLLNVGGTPRIEWFDILLGNFPGAMGTTCVLVLLAVLLFFCFRKIISYKIVLSALVTAALYATLFPRVVTGTLNSVVYELISGVFLFGLAFLACDQDLAPQKTAGQILYGIVFALLVMIFRTVGALDIETVFVLLVMNALSREFDRYGNWLIKGVKFLWGKLRGNASKTEAGIEKAGDGNA